MTGLQALSGLRLANSFERNLTYPNRGGRETTHNGDGARDRGPRGAEGASSTGRHWPVQRQGDEQAGPARIRVPALDLAFMPAGDAPHQIKAKSRAGDIADIGAAHIAIEEDGPQGGRNAWALVAHLQHRRRASR